MIAGDDDLGDPGYVDPSSDSPHDLEHGGDGERADDGARDRGEAPDDEHGEQVEGLGEEELPSARTRG